MNSRTRKKWREAAQKAFGILASTALTLSLLPVVALTPQTAYARTDGTVAAETVDVLLLGKGGEAITLASYVADKENDTYVDSGDLEIPGVVEVEDFENGSLGVKDYILYTGSDNGNFSRGPVVTKYIELEALASTLTDGAYDSEEWLIKMATADGSWVTYYGVPGGDLAGKTVDSRATLYASADWLKATVENNYRGSSSLLVDGYDDKYVVPTVLAICSYNERINQTRPTVDGLEEWADNLAASNDMGNALRLFSGMALGSSNGKYVNTGSNSQKGVSAITLMPTYNTVAVEGGALNGVEGEDGFAIALENAVVTTSDNYLKAAKGETVELSIVPDEGYCVESVEVTAGEEMVVVAESEGLYAFEMPASAVSVVVTVVEGSGSGAESAIWDGSVDTSWYNAEDAEFVLTTPAQLAGLAAIVNGTADGIAKDDFAGKTVELGSDIALGEDGLYVAVENVTYGTGGYPLTTTQYYLQDAALVWTPIGSGSASGNTNASGSSFAGTFDGKGHTVSGVYTGTKSSSAGNTATVQGLFGIVSGTVKNLTVGGCITGKIVVGGIVAHLAGGTVENCVNNAVVFADGGTTPGAGKENGAYRGGAVGGIVGNAMSGSSVTDCLNYGNVVCANTAMGGRVAGIIGLIDGSNYVVTVCRNGNHGKIEGYQYVTGIVGMNYSSKAPVDQCYNVGGHRGPVRERSHQLLQRRKHHAGAQHGQQELLRRRGKRLRVQQKRSGHLQLLQRGRRLLEAQCGRSRHHQRRRQQDRQLLLPRYGHGRRQHGCQERHLQDRR